MQKAEEPAAEAEPQRRRCFCLEREGGIVQRQLLQRLAQSGKIVGINRKQPAEYHRYRRFEAFERRLARAAFLGDGIADTRIRNRLHAGIDEPDLAGSKLIHRRRLWREHTNAFHHMCGTCPHHANFHTLADLAMLYPHQRHHTKIGVIPAVNQQCRQRGLYIAHRRRHFFHHRFQNVRDTCPGLGACLNSVICRKADHLFDLGLHPLGFCRRQVNLVQYRHDLVIRLHRLIHIGQCLRLNPLAGINHQQRSFASGQRARHFIAEIHMARCVHQVQHIILAVFRLVVQPHRLRLDGDPPLALDIHIVEHLIRHLAVSQPATDLNQPVGDGRFAMVNMRDNREIADLIWCGHRNFGLFPVM